MTRIRTHPGEVLYKEFMEPCEVTPAALSKDTGIPFWDIINIINGDQCLTEGVCHALAKRFNTSYEFWENLQQMHNNPMR